VQTLFRIISVSISGRQGLALGNGQTIVTEENCSTAFQVNIAPHVTKHLASFLIEIVGEVKTAQVIANLCVEFLACHNDVAWQQIVNTFLTRPKKICT